MKIFFSIWFVGSNYVWNFVFKSTMTNIAMKENLGIASKAYAICRICMSVLSFSTKLKWSNDNNTNMNTYARLETYAVRK